MRKTKGYPSQKYDFALSFSGKDRKFVEEVAGYLDFLGAKVFYDLWERHGLIGEDLYTYLADLYQNRARYCVMFISKNYVNKAWPRHERRFAQARAFSSRQPYIIPVRLDATACPGIPPTIGYIDGKRTSPSSIAILLLRKLGIQLREADASEFVLSQKHKWRITSTGKVSVRSSFSFLWLGKGTRDHYHIDIYSPDNRRLNVMSFEAFDDTGKLRTTIDAVTEARRYYRILFREPLSYGEQVDFHYQLVCEDYFPNLLDPCSDYFGVGLPTNIYDCEFIFPRNSLLRNFELFRTVGRKTLEQVFFTGVTGGCPVAFFTYKRPESRAIFKVKFLLDWPPTLGSSRKRTRIKDRQPKVCRK